MPVRVCPICDKRMKFAHFCTNCKTYIKEPVYWNKAYNLNGEGSESTIVNQCENHDHTMENATGKIRSNYNITVYKRQNSKVQKNNKKNPIVILILVYIMIQILLPMIVMLLNLFLRF